MGALITSITNPSNHAASRFTRARAPGCNRHYPKLGPRLADYYYHYHKSQSARQHGKRTKTRMTLATVLKAVLIEISAVVSLQFFSAEKNSFLSGLACFMIEINVPFASST